MTLGNRRNPRRHRRREQRGLPRRRRRGQQRLQVFGEAHVEHLVGFVEHQDFELIERQRLTPEMIERASRRGHDDVDATVQGADLLIHRRAAVERHDGQRRVLRVLVYGLGDLHGQLARRDQDQSAGVAARGAGLRDQAIDQRQRERRGLARTGPRLPNQIPPRSQHRDRLSLNGRRLFVAERDDGLDDSRAETEGRESHGHGSVGRRRCLGVMRRISHLSLSYPLSGRVHGDPRQTHRASVAPPTWRACRGPAAADSEHLIQSLGVETGL
jgi:hypothetical protein